MQRTSGFSKILRAAVVSGSLLTALAFGSVAASDNTIGFTECDQGCAAVSSGNAASFQMVRVTPLSPASFVADGPGEIGFTR